MNNQTDKKEFDEIMNKDIINISYYHHIDIIFLNEKKN